jgi:hypothetical protein
MRRCRVALSASLFSSVTTCIGERQSTQCGVEHRRNKRGFVRDRGVPSTPRPFFWGPFGPLPGLYLAGFSHQHREIRTFALDGFREVEWRKGDRFDYPIDYRPEQLTEGAFGLIRGELTRVRIRFDPRVARYVQRRMWHPTQQFRRVDGGIEMTMEVRGTTETLSWVLGFGDKALVIEPTNLRSQVLRELLNATRSYSRGLRRGNNAGRGVNRPDFRARTAGVWPGPRAVLVFPVKTGTPRAIEGVRS